MKTLGIDIGTTTISIILSDTDDRHCSKALTVQNKSRIRTQYRWEKVQDVTGIIDCAVEAAEGYLRRFPDIKAIGLTGQMHGILYLNREGKCISPLYTWQDGRGNIPRRDGRTMVEAVYEKCGLYVPSGYGLLTHLFNTENGIAPDQAVSVCTIMDYLGMVLTGRRTPVVHVTNAAGLGFFDTRKKKFLTELLEQLKLDPAILPEVTEEPYILGEHRGIPVMAALGDNQASFLGAAGEAPNTYLVNIGTGGQISVISDRYYEIEGIETRPFVGGKYLLAGSSLCGGRAYAVLENFFRSYVEAAGHGNISQYEIMEKLAREAYGEHSGLEIVTTFNGTRSKPELRGSIAGISEDNFTPGGVICGVLKGIVRELYDMYIEIRSYTEIGMDRLAASGNAVRKNKVLQKIIKEMFLADPVLPETLEEAAYGAAVYAGNILKNTELEGRTV